MKTGSQFRKGRRGYAMKNGKFYSFDRHKVLVLKGWPDPRAWVKSPRKGWRHGRKDADQLFSAFLFQDHERPPVEKPDLDLVELPEYLEPHLMSEEEREKTLSFHRWLHMVGWKEKHLLADFFDQIPVSIRTELMYYSTRKWHVMNLMARCPGAFDLHFSNPALCYALASNWVFHTPGVKQPMRAARSLIRKKQKEALRWLGFPASESARRILRKIDSKALSVESLLYLRQTLTDPGKAKILAHLPRINTGALRLINDVYRYPLLSPRLIEEAAIDREQDEEPYAFLMLQDALRMNRRQGGGFCPERFSSMARLRECHDELSAIMQDQMESDSVQLPEQFPNPPLVGTAEIQPITTLTDLVHEGRTMHHCVASYAQDVVSGMQYIYRVTAPVRATLSLRSKNGNWLPGQIYLACNERVPAAVKKEILGVLMKTPAFKEVDAWVPHNNRGEVVKEMTGETRSVVNNLVNLFTEPVPENLQTGT